MSNRKTHAATPSGTNSGYARMHRNLFKTVLGAACALAPLAAVPAGPAHAQSVVRPSQEIILSIGRGELITVPGNMADLFVANDAVADVQVKSQRQLYVFGKTGGETTVYASNAAGDIIWSANIRVGSNIDSIDQMLKLAMPDAKIAVSTMGSNTVLLTGTVGAPEDAAEVDRLVQAFLGEDANVISRLKMATPLQVNLRVRIAEVSRSVVRTLGANLTSMDSTGGIKFGVGQGRNFYDTFSPGLPMGTQPDGVTVTLPDGTEVAGTNLNPVTTGTTLGLAGSLLGLDLLGALDLAETQGLLTTLAEPNLTALSGETAEFLAGGEFPILVPQSLGTTSVEYKKYGVSLAYSPTVLSNGRISLRVRPEVSELSSQGAVTISGNQIPALTTRRAETTVELGSGQSFMIAGLLSNSAQNAITKAPGIGDMPILGALFKSTDFRKGQTELVIVVTPYLVNPVDDADIRLPTDGFQAPNQLESWLLGKDVGGDSGDPRPAPRAADPSAPYPQVGVADQNGTALAEGGRGREERQAAAAPGFSIN